MEIFVYLVILILFWVISYSQKKTIESKIERIDKKINIVYKELINQKGSVNVSKDENVVAKTISQADILQEKPKSQKQPEVTLSKPEIRLEESLEKIEKEIIKKKTKVIPKVNVEPIKKQPVLAVSTKSEEIKTLVTPVLNERDNISPKFKVKEKNNDFESIIGENLLPKIGIGVLILGIGFLVRFSIEKDFINELGRVLIGLASGSILLSISFFLRKSYRAFSSVLAGGGIAVFYYTVTIAYKDYAMFSQPVAFSIMMAITILTTYLALKFNRKELAIIALLGGFTSPFMVSGESNNYISFFTYIAILNVGMLLLAYFKKWNVINLLAYVFTILLFGGWLALNLDEQTVVASFVFATIFYLIFYAGNLVYTVRKKEMFDAGQFISLLSTTLMYFIGVMFILSYYKGGSLQGVFTVSLAVFNLLVALFVFSSKSIDKNLFYLVLGKAVVLITMFAPIQLDGNYISVFWLVETVVLIWLSQRTKMRVFKDISVIVFVFACFSLFINWMGFYVFNTDTNSLFINEGFLASIIAIVTYFISIFLLNNEEEQNKYLVFTAKGFGNMLKIWLGFIAYLSILFELNKGANFDLVYDEIFFSPTRYFGSSVTILLNYGYHFIVAIVFLLIFRKNKNELFKTFAFVGVGFLILLYLLVGNNSAINIRSTVLYEKASSCWILLRYCVSLFMILSVVLCYFNYIKNQKGKGITNAFYVFFVLCTIYSLSIELDHIAVYSQVDFSSLWLIVSNGTDNILSFTQKAGYSILWGLCSFVFMYFGMKNKLTILRILSLGLFFVVILKLVIFDLHNMSSIGRYISFICLGILLLIVSFMYQRLRKLINEGK